MIPKLEAWNTAMEIFASKNLQQLSTIFVQLGKPVYRTVNEKFVIKALNMVYMKKVREYTRLGTLEEKLND